MFAWACCVQAPLTGTYPLLHLEQYVLPLIVTSHLPAAQFVAPGSAASHGVGAETAAFASSTTWTAWANCRIKLTKRSLLNIDSVAMYWYL
eukprot:XP_001708718.1 Hypothetical protein GL50803_118590 [Giardia lamblia ATCC 50803]